MEKPYIIALNFVSHCLPIGKNINKTFSMAFVYVFTRGQHQEGVVEWKWMQGVHHKIHIGGARMFFSSIVGRGEGVVRAWHIIISGAIVAPPVAGPLGGWPIFR